MIEPMINAFYKTLGANIKAARENSKKYITQENLALQIGMSRTSIVNIEQGRHRIQVHTLLDICKNLNINIFEIIPSSNEELSINAPQINRPLDARETDSVQKILSIIENKEVELNVTKNNKFSSGNTKKK